MVHLKMLLSKPNFMKIIFIPMLCLAATMLCLNCTTIKIKPKSIEKPIDTAKKVFVLIESSYVPATEYLNLMPQITRKLRERGYTVTSAVITKNSDQAALDRIQTRKLAFQAEYQLRILQTKDAYRVKTGPRSVILVKEYELALTDLSSDQDIWLTTMETNQGFIGSESKRIAKSLFKQMQLDGVLPKK
jgi:hypothetical protein